MFLTDAPVTMPDLSCYTTNLLAYLAPDMPDIRRLLARSVRLAVRADLPPGELAFSHHARVDTRADGRELSYRGAAEWPAARTALLDLLERDERVLAVGNTRHLPWSPAYGRAEAPHWLLLRGHRDGRWLVADHFAALTPHGEQEPYLGWLGDAELAQALTLQSDPPREVARRDRLALGQEVPVPPAGRHRWLAWESALAGAGARAEPGPGRWLCDLEPSLSRIAGAFRADPASLTRHVDDLWAAARHHVYRLAIGAVDGTVHQERAATASAAWGELPKTLRFAAQSAARGRPRPSVVERSFEQLLTAHQALDTAFPQEG